MVWPAACLGCLCLDSRFWNVLHWTPTWTKVALWVLPSADDMDMHPEHSRTISWHLFWVPWSLSSQTCKVEEDRRVLQQEQLRFDSEPGAQLGQNGWRTVEVILRRLIYCRGWGSRSCAVFVVSTSWQGHWCGWLYEYLQSIPDMRLLRTEASCTQRRAGNAGEIRFKSCAGVVQHAACSYCSTQSCWGETAQVRDRKVKDSASANWGAQKLPSQKTLWTMTT
jgi:hypothetical protein